MKLTIDTYGFSYVDDHGRAICTVDAKDPDFWVQSSRECHETAQTAAEKSYTNPYRDNGKAPPDNRLAQHTQSDATIKCTRQTVDCCSANPS